jgi:hypothetical protein
MNAKLTMIDARIRKEFAQRLSNAHGARAAHQWRTPGSFLARMALDDRADLRTMTDLMKGPTGGRRSMQLRAFLGITLVEMWEASK